MAKRLLLLGVGLALAGSAQAQGQKALGELFSGDASVRGAVLLRAQATEVLSGSQIAAGEGSALLKLTRGGQLRICPRTNLSLNAGAAGTALSLGLNAGAMELDYALESGADSLITPDFRLLLISPGSFHLAISVGSSGDTCMRSLPGNSAAVFVTEMMGNDSYQLSPGKNVLFLKGKISMATEAPAMCGCPESAPPKTLPRTEVAEARPANAPLAEAAETAAKPGSSQGPSSAMLPGAGAIAPAAPEQAAPEQAAPEQESTVSAERRPGPPSPAEQPEVAHLEVESRFSYRGNEAVQDFYGTVARLSLSTDNSKLALALLPQITPPAQPSAPAVETPKAKITESQPGGGFLHRFFKRLFGH
jgi:hypothetical protein